MDEPPKIESVLNTQRILPSKAALILSNFLAAHDEDDQRLPNDDDDGVDSDGQEGEPGGKGDAFSFTERGKGGKDNVETDEMFGVNEEVMTRLNCVLDSLSGRKRGDDDENETDGPLNFSSLVKKASSSTKKSKKDTPGKRGRSADDVNEADEAAGGATPPHSQSEKTTGVKVKEENSNRTNGSKHTEGLSKKELKKKAKQEKKEEKKEKKALKKAMKKAKKEAKEEKKRKKREKSLGGGGDGDEGRSSKRQKIKDETED